MKLGVGKFLILIIFFAVTSVVLRPLLVSAAPGNFNRSEWYGYYDNDLDYYGGALTGRLASISSTSGFISEIKDMLDNGTSKQKKVATFIVRTMSGLGTPSGYSAPTPAQIANWETRVNRYIEGGTGALRVNFSNSHSQGASDYNTYWQDSQNDVAWYTESLSNVDTIRFYNSSGTTHYRIKKDCGNPIGDMPGLDDTPKWTLSASASASGGNSPGDTITWTHRVTNGGPDATNELVKFDYINSQDLGTGTGTNIDIASGWADGDSHKKTYYTNPPTNSTKPTKNVYSTDAGKTFCRATRVWRKAWNTSRFPDPDRILTSSPACVTIPYDYDLHPGVGLNPSNAIEPGTSVAVTPAVSNDGPTISRDTNWRLTKIILGVGTARPNGSNNSAVDPCGPSGSFFSGCTAFDSGNSVFSASGSVYSGDALSAVNYTADDLDAGSQICFALSVRPRSSASANWAHSSPACVVIGKRPKAQIWGGDLLVGGKTDTSTSNKVIGGSNRTFGSWVEYAIFATGMIKGTASGAAFADTGMPTDTSTSAACKYSTLSFANVPSIPVGSLVCTGGSGTIGSYSNLPDAPDISTSFQGGAAIPDGTGIPNNWPSNVYSTGNITLNASTLAPGKSIIIKSSGTVTIVEDQKYDSNNGGAGYTKITQIPQLVIIASNINIADTVEHIDAWLIARGNINTCSSVGGASLAVNAGLSVNMCKDMLVVNGPVMTNRLYLRRTAGSESGSASGDPAEVFNLRADAYLWAYARASGAGRILTVHTTELPPRY